MCLYIYTYTYSLSLSLSLSHTHTFIYVYTEIDGADKWTTLCTSFIKSTPKPLPASIKKEEFAGSQAGELLRGKEILAKYRSSISGYTRKLEFYDSYDEILGLVGDAAAGESETAETDFKIEISKIGFSMVANDRQEFMYASIHNIAFHRNETLGCNSEKSLYNSALTAQMRH